jgi:3',5'-cyclic AMP phosphodiesterase CpdA
MLTSLFGFYLTSQSMFYNIAEILGYTQIMRHKIKTIVSSALIPFLYLLIIYNPCLFADNLEKNNWHSKASTNINISKRDINTKLAPSQQMSNTLGIFFEDFESGQGKWKATNGLWEIGEPTSGPDSAYSGLNCAGTNLKGNYPNDAETRLISPTISLPTLSKKTDRIRLIFQNWYAMEYRSDFGYVQISTDGGSNWTTPDNSIYSGSWENWHYGVADLTSYAGKNVNIAFLFTSDSSSTDYGWYLDDVFVEYVESIATESLEINIASNGQFTMGIPNGTILLFGHPNPLTSATTFRIDGKDYWNYYLSSWGKAISLPQTKGLSNTTTWDIDKIQFNQTLSIVEGSTTGNLDTAEIKYVVTNKDTVSHEIGVRVMLDTMLGENDGAPFRIPKAGGVTTEREFLKNNMPMYWQAFDDLTSPSFQSQGTLVGGLATIPDRFITVGWSHINETAWECETIPNQDFDYTYSDYYDSAVGIYWFPIKLSPGQSKEFVTYYGLGGIDIDIQPPLVVGLSAPEKVIINKNDISKKFTLTAYLNNSSPGVTKTATGITTELILPKGLSLAEDEIAIQNIPDLRINEDMQTSYDINIGDVGGKLTYSLIVTASNVAKKTVNKDIFVFGVETSPLNEYISVTKTPISAKFNIDMDANIFTFNNASFIVSSDKELSIAGTVKYNPITRTVTFEPLSDLKANTLYNVTLTKDVKSSSGVALPYEIIWHFSTPVADPVFSFVHITDVHYGTEKDENIKSDWSGWWMYYVINYSNFIDTLKDIKYTDPDFILVSGDNVEWPGPDTNLSTGLSSLSPPLSFFSGFNKVLDRFFVRNNNGSEPTEPDDGQKLDIPVYIVPGNHDRYASFPLDAVIDELFGIGGNDHLNMYYNSMGSPTTPMNRHADNVTIFPGFDAKPTNDKIDEGVDRYNYYFEHGGYIFIGLDSGADTDLEGRDLRKLWADRWYPTGDWGPEGAGLSFNHISALYALTVDKPKIIFMHHPILTGNRDDNKGGISSLNGDYEDASIVGNHEAFVKYCKNKDVRMVLTGHTHENWVFTAKDYIKKDGFHDYTGLVADKESSWSSENNETLFIQTPSASKDSENYGNGEFHHGYRVVTVDGLDKITQQFHETNTNAYPKFVMTGFGEVVFNVYDALGRITGGGDGKSSANAPAHSTTSRLVDNGDEVVEIPDSYYTGYYGPSTLQTILLYGIDEEYRFKVVGVNEGIYDLGIGFLGKGEKDTTFTATDIPITAGAVHQYTVDWETLAQGGKGVTIQMDFDGDGTFEETINTGAIFVNLPKTFAMPQNYPNPFSNETKIDYQLPRDCKVDLKIYDVTGRLVKTLINNDEKMAGYHTVLWDGKNDIGENVVNGIYFYVIKADNYNKIGKMVLIR